jgi:two-component system chemotaxis sensor kinase CheA
MRLRAAQLSTVLHQGEMIALHDELIPFFRLNRLFEIDEAQDDPTQGLVVVVEVDGRQVGLLIDELLGQQQIVIKNLGESLHGIAGVSGGAIMPDGRVGLVLDITRVVRLASSARGDEAGSFASGVRAMGRSEDAESVPV